MARMKHNIGAKPAHYTVACSQQIPRCAGNITCFHEPIPGGFVGMSMPEYTCFPPQLYPGAICTYDCQDRGMSHKTFSGMHMNYQRAPVGMRI
jgi:hypothetical protein